MPLYRMSPTSLTPVEKTTFQAANLKERQHLQRLLREDISVVGDDLIVVAEEFGDWEDSQRRIDLLCLDRQAHLVVVEIKRTDDGGHMELQAIRYAAMVSSITLERVVTAYARMLGGAEFRAAAEAAIASFLGVASSAEATLAGPVRIVLVSADFSREITSSVLWLNSCGLDITCIRMRPYRVADQVVVDVQQIIPIPEAADYEVRLRALRAEEAKADLIRHETRRRFWKQFIVRVGSRIPAIASRTAPKANWMSWRYRPGLSFAAVVLKDECRVEIYIDYGDGSGDRSTQIFEALKARRDAIEARFGEALEWQELPEGRACRICRYFEGGWMSPEPEWPSIHDTMATKLSALQLAIEPTMGEIKA
jgi:Domain of unknown function (DUF4268)